MRPILAALALALPLAAQAASPGWNGTYVWEEAPGRVGGSEPKDSAAIFVTHTLTIGSRTCRLDAEGYQTAKRIKCIAVPRGASLVIRFAGKADKGRSPAYAKGADLLTLTDDGGRFVTQLQALHDSQGRAARGELFRKVR